MTDHDLREAWQRRPVEDRSRANCLSEDEWARLMAGDVSDAERRRLAGHIATCRDCAEEYRLLQPLESWADEAGQTSGPAAFRTALPARLSPRSWAAAAAAVIAIGGGVWMATQQDTPLTPGEPAAVARPAVPEPLAPAALSPAIVALAQVDPPPFVTLTMRSAGTNAFEAAMEPYARGDYEQAAARLMRIVDSDSAPPRVHFYLAASELMLGRPERAIHALQQVVRSGHAGYTEHGRLLLAKAWLARGRVPEARGELAACAALGGTHAAEARALLARLDAASP